MPTFQRYQHEKKYLKHVLIRIPLETYQEIADAAARNRWTLNGTILTFIEWGLDPENSK